MTGEVYSVRVRVCVCVRVRACVCACVRVCVRACVTVIILRTRIYFLTRLRERIYGY